MPKKIYLILTIFPLLAAGCSKTPLQPPADNLPLYPSRLMLGSEILQVEIANTDAKREQGLSGKDAMQGNQGMLFDFKNSPNPRPAFWMKGMRFALDLIWIKDFKIVGITANIPPPNAGDANLPLYSPPQDVDMVLELNAGWSGKHGIRSGNIIFFENNK